MHVGHARNATLGDALANVLQAAGNQVEREYYFNDARRADGPVRRVGRGALPAALGRDAEVPEDGYHGDYVTDFAEDILATRGRARRPPARERSARSARGLRARARRRSSATLARFGVRSTPISAKPTWRGKGEIDAAVERLRAAGHAYEADGAVWFRSTDFGDDKDRVIVRSNGVHTYFGADCAYVIDKFERGFDHLIYVWGADHHGDVVRVKGAAAALATTRRRSRSSSISSSPSCAPASR